jgi:hypothetical protein
MEELLITELPFAAIEDGIVPPLTATPHFPSRFITPLFVSLPEHLQYQRVCASLIAFILCFWHTIHGIYSHTPWE